MGANPLKAELKDRTYRIARLLLAGLPLNQEVQTSDEKWAERTGTSRSIFGRHRYLFEKLGILKMENRWTTPGDGVKAPRMIFFTRLTDEAETYRLLDKHFAEGGAWTVNETRPDPLGSNSPAAKARRLAKKAKAEPIHLPSNNDWGPTVEDETVAIVGEDAPEPMAALAPARKDEGQALIEAARQYNNRNQAVIDHIEAIEALGIKVDRNTVIGAMELPADDRLDAVSDVLDYVTGLEQRVERLERQVGSLNTERRELLAYKSATAGELDRLRAANRRMSEARAQQSVAASQ